MGDAFVADQLEDRLGADRAQADAQARIGGEGPGEAPAVAVEHRQRPQVTGVLGHAPGDDVRQRVQRRTPVVIDDAFRIARGAGGIVQADRVPFVVGQGPVEVGVAFGQQLGMGDVADALAALETGVFDVDDQQVGTGGDADGAGDGLSEFGVDQQHLGFGMVQDEGDGFRVEAGVDGVQHRAGHGDGKMGLEHLGDVGGDDGHGVAAPDTARGKRRGEAARAGVGFGPVAADRAVTDRRLVGIDRGGARDEGQGRELHEIGRIGVQSDVIDVGAGHLFPPRWMLCAHSLSQTRPGCEGGGGGLRGSHGGFSSPAWLPGRGALPS